MPTNLLSILMLVTGAVLAFGGLLIARSGHRFGATQLSVPTRVVIGMCSAVIGYHLIVWSFPPSLTSVQFNRQLWWVVVGLAALLPFLSLLLDRRGLPHPRGHSSPPPRDDQNSIR